MYKEEYDQEVNIALSAQELIDCVGRDHGIENGCNGIPVSWGFDYVFENGIAFRYYYPHTNVYGECKVIPNEHKYHIAGYEKPEVYNKYGLFELLKKGPVAVTLGLDPEYFQFYQNDRETGPYFNTGYYRPSVYGVLLESNQYKEDGLEEVIEWPYFFVETRLRACDSLVFRLPILESVDNANIGGIAGFAVRPIVNEPVNEDMKIIPVEKPTTIVPTEAATTQLPTTLPLPTTTLPPTTLPPTTTQPPTTQPPTTLTPINCDSTNELTISSDSDCSRLLESGWTSITVNEGLCNSLTSNLTISDNPCLLLIDIKKNSLKNLNSLVISNITQLSSIITGDGEYGENNGVFYYVKSVEFSSIF